MFWWMDGWTIRRSEGRTRDISEDGAFVFANAWPPEMQVRSEFFLPVLRESNASQGWRRKGKYCVLNRPGGARNATVCNSNPAHGIAS